MLTTANGGAGNVPVWNSSGTNGWHFAEVLQLGLYGELSFIMGSGKIDLETVAELVCPKSGGSFGYPVDRHEAGQSLAEASESGLE